jgi:hypothetical protein
MRILYEKEPGNLEEKNLKMRKEGMGRIEVGMMQVISSSGGLL